jgi:hypothetical protein
MTFSSGYERTLRRAFEPEAEGARQQRIWIRRVSCKRCRTSPGLPPAFCVSRRLDVVEVIGAVIGAVAGGSPLAAAAEQLAVPRSTARGWVRRFAEQASGIASAFASLAVGLGSGPFDLSPPLLRAAVEAVGRAWDAARSTLAGNVVGMWRFVVAVSGGALLDTSRAPP